MSGHPFTGAAKSSSGCDGLWGASRWTARGEPFGVRGGVGRRGRGWKGRSGIARLEWDAPRRLTACGRTTRSGIGVGNALRKTFAKTGSGGLVDRSGSLWYRSFNSVSSSDGAFCTDPPTTGNPFNVAPHASHTSEQTWVSLTSGLPSRSATARASVAGASRVRSPSPASGAPSGSVFIPRTRRSGGFPARRPRRHARRSRDAIDGQSKHAWHARDDRASSGWTGGSNPSREARQAAPISRVSTFRPLSTRPRLRS